MQLALVTGVLAGCGRVGFSARETGDAGGIRDDASDASTLDPALLLWFPLDEPMTNQGMTQSTITCAPACPATTAGVRGTAAAFDGSTTALRIADRPELHITAGTIALWMRPTALPPQGYAYSAGGTAHGGASLNSWEVYFYNTASGMLLYSGGDAAGGPQANIAWTRPTGTWLHVAASWDGTTRQHLYVDGVEVASDVQFPLVYDGHDVIIGADETNFGIQNRFVGDLDDFRVYNRELSAAEIAQLATP